MQEHLQEMANSLEAIHSAKVRYKRACDDFIKAFREKRKQEKLSLRYVAKDMGITPMYLSDMELGRRAPSLDMKTYFSWYPLQIRYEQPRYCR